MQDNHTCISPSVNGSQDFFFPPHMANESQLLAEVTALIGDCRSAPTSLPAVFGSASTHSVPLMTYLSSGLTPALLPEPTGANLETARGKAQQSIASLNEASAGRLSGTVSAETVDMVFRHLEKTKQDIECLELETLLRKLREEEARKIQVAIELLESEISFRKRRCNAISAQIGKLQREKVDVLTGIAAQARAVMTQSDAPVVDSLPLQGVACGPLTKRSVDAYYTKYWAAKAKSSERRLLSGANEQ